MFYLILLFISISVKTAGIPYIRHIPNPTGGVITVIKIAICDDEEKIRTQLSAICKKVKQDTDEIYIYQDGEEILNDLPQKKFDLIFLDIEMPKISGIEIKNRMEAMNEFPCIVFVTSHEEFVFDAYGIGVIKFIKKPFKECDIYEVIGRCRNLYKNRKVFVLTDINGEKRSFLQKDIVYIKAEGVYSTLYFNGGIDFSIRKSLLEWEKDIEDESFCRLSRSLLINFDKVCKLSDSFFMDNGDKLKIPKRRSEIKRLYWKYIEKGAYNI